MQKEQKGILATSFYKSSLSTVFQKDTNIINEENNE